MDFSNKYVLGFTLAICLVASGAVASIADVLRERIDRNQILDQQRQVIRVAGLVAADDPLPEEKVAELFKSIEGKVIAVGNGRRNDKGEVQKLEVKKGDRVLFGKYAGTEVKIDGGEHVVLREDDILGIVTK